MNTAPTVQRTTVEAPAADAAPDKPAVAAPPAAPGTPGAAPAAGEPAVDHNLDIARRLEGISKKEAKARRAEQELHTQRASFEADQAKLAAKLAELDEALGDPVGHLLKIGKDPVEVANRFTHPETPAEKRIRVLEEKLAKDAEENDKRAKDYEEQQTKEQRHRVVSAFVSGINPDDHPYLVASHAPEEIPRLVSNLLNRRLDPRDPDSETVQEAFFAQHKRNPTDAELRESLESEAEERATKIVKSHQARTAVAPSQAPGQGQSQARPSGPSGISNQHAAVTTAGKKRPLTLEEKRKQARRELTEALEAEATDRT